MTPDVAKRVIEGALLCANRPLAINDIRQLFDEENEVSPDTIQTLLDELRQDWQGRSVELVPLASGWRFQCAADVARHVLRLQPERVPRYSRAVMETLAIIAYHQPVTRGDIEEIRGVGVSAHIIKTLEDRGWIDQVGVKEVPGRPALFATTRQFLDDLNLRSLKDLPPLDDGLPNQDLLELTGQPAPALEASVGLADEAGPVPDEGVDEAEGAGGSEGQAGVDDEASAPAIEALAQGEPLPAEVTQDEVLQDDVPQDEVPQDEAPQDMRTDAGNSAHALPVEQEAGVARPTEPAAVEDDGR